jgi:hypothetical protein
MRTGGLRLIWSNPIVRAGPHACKVPKGQPVRWGTRSRGVRFACGCYGASNRSSFGLLVLCGVGWLASSRLSFGFHHVAFFESIKHEKEKLVLIADVLRWVFFFFFYVCCVWFVSPSVRASTTKTVISCVEAVRWQSGSGLALWFVVSRLNKAGAVGCSVSSLTQCAPR